MTLREIWETLSVDALNFWRGAVSSAESLLPAEGKALAERVTGVTPYDDLPFATTPEPPTDESLDSLDPKIRGQFDDLEMQLAAALGAIGAGLTRLETRRTDERQGWLWGIGRLYRAAGRTGIVTNVRTANGPHGEGRAVDYNYPAHGASESDILAALKSVADSRPDLTWGGSFLSLHDPAHWEVKV